MDPPLSALGMKGARKLADTLAPILDGIRAGKLKDATTFSVSLERSTTDEVLGIDVEVGPAELGITSITEGLVSTWNRANPDLEVKPGDRVVAVNGIKGNAKVILGSMRGAGPITVEIARNEPRQVVVASSPLLRVIQTAIHGRLAAEIVLHPLLRETHSSDADGPSGDVRPGDEQVPEVVGHSAEMLNKDASLQQLLSDTGVSLNYDFLGPPCSAWWTQHAESNAETATRAKDFLEWLRSREEKVAVVVAHSCISKYLWDMEGAKKTAGWCNHFPMNAPAAYILLLTADSKALTWRRALTRSKPLTTDEIEEMTKELGSKIVFYIRHGVSTANEQRRADRKRAKAHPAAVNAEVTPAPVKIKRADRKGAKAHPAAVNVEVTPAPVEIKRRRTRWAAGVIDLAVGGN